MSRAAVFLDRDGTVIADRHYLGDPAGVALLPGAGEAIARINQAGLLAVLVTNQSGIGRGFFSEADFQAVQDRLADALAAHGAHLDGIYHCPHSPAQPVPCDCRKPATGLFERAARDLHINLAASWFAGDRLRDVTPATRWGGTGILLGRSDPPGDAVPGGVLRFPSLAEAVRHILRPPPGN